MFDFNIWLSDHQTIVQTVSTIIQAIAAFIILFLTVISIVLTKKTFHVPYKSYMMPVKVSYENHKWVIKVKNIRPGLATNVKVKSIMVTSMRLIQPRKDSQFISFQEEKMTDAKGSFIIEPGMENDYELNFPT